MSWLSKTCVKVLVSSVNLKICDIYNCRLNVFTYFKLTLILDSNNKAPLQILLNLKGNSRICRANPNNGHQTKPVGPQVHRAWVLVTDLALHCGFCTM